MDLPVEWFDLLEYFGGSALPVFEHLAVALTVALLTRFFGTDPYDLSLLDFGVSDVTASTAGSHGEHRIRFALYAVAISCIEGYLLFVLVFVAVGASGEGWSLQFLYRVPYLDVAVEAIDFVCGHMIMVNEVGIGVSFDILGSIMTGQTAVLGHEPVTFYNIRMAVPAVDRHLFDDGVVVSDVSERELFSGDFVAECAAGASLVELLPLEVAEEAGSFGVRDMLTLDDLRVAIDAA